MVLHGLRYVFQKPCPHLSSSERTQQLRSKTVYSGTVNLAKTIAAGNNNRYNTYNGPYEVVNENGNSTMIASQSYDDLLSITKGKVLLNQLPLNSTTQTYYQNNFGNNEMYVGVFNQFDPSFNFVGGHTGCNSSVMVYDISVNGFTGSYKDGGFIGITGPSDSNGFTESYKNGGFGGLIGITGPPDSNDKNNKHIFIDPDRCYYSDPCLMSASYTRFVSHELAGLTGTGAYIAQKIINADQYRGFTYPMPNFNLSCVQQLPNQSTGPLFCSPVYQRNTLTTTFPLNMYKITYLNSNGNSTPVPQLNGFTVYQFGVGGTIPLDADVTHSITYSGSGPLDIYYAVIGGGGGGGSTYYYSGLNPASSGGGGGGFFYSTFPSSSSVQLLSNVTYSISVGGGGSAGSLSGPNGQNGSNGKNSVINFNGGSQIGYGGGGGATAYTTSGGIIGTGSSGNGGPPKGNGGGGAGSGGASGMGGSGTFNGGPGSNTYAGAGGGGGMTQAGGAVSGKVSDGGNGISSSISGSTQYFGAGGGGGAATNNTDNIAGIGGQGGGGNGGWWNNINLPNFVVPQNGENVFGSGGGGAPSILPPAFTQSSIQGANGGSGSVWIRFNSYAITN